MTAMAEIEETERRQKSDRKDARGEVSACSYCAPMPVVAWNSGGVHALFRLHNPCKHIYIYAYILVLCFV